MILVTGAAGGIGRAACRCLAEAGILFRAAFHTQDDQEVRDMAVDTVKLDIADQDSVRNAVKGIDAVLFVPPATPSLAAMTGTLLAALRDAEVKHLVKVSAYGEEESALSELGAWHAAADTLVHNADIPNTLLHCLPFMQNIFYILDVMIKPRRAILLPCGGARVSHVDVRDIAAVACRVLAAPDAHAGKRYVLSGPEAVSYAQIAEMLSEQTGERIMYRDIPESDAARMLTQMGLPETVAKAKLVSFRLEKENRRAYVSPHVAEITSRPARSFRQFLSDYARYFTL
ncbi:MAG TPA: SDR family NAD(P)-dependent oxidoreductase [Spirochaetia bacterium]|nr:SDR family NAD(P)-dependent oxidoreductase [Spirochaetia bacterium]